MDKHFRLTDYNEPDSFDEILLISNRADDVIGKINIRAYEKHLIPEIKGLLNDLSFSELKDIMTNFVKVCEKTAEFDKVGQSYYIAKRWVRNNECN